MTSRLETSSAAREGITILPCIAILLVKDKIFIYIIVNLGQLWVMGDCWE